MCANLPRNAIVRLSHSQNGDSQGQETFLAHSTDKQTRNYDRESSNHYPSQLPRSTAVEPEQHKMVSHIHAKLPRNVPYI